MMLVLRLISYLISKIMINTKVYSQRDIRWFLGKVGFGKGNFRSVGCTTTALTSLLFIFGYNLIPPQVAERLRNAGAYQKGTDLILWSIIQKAFPVVKFVYRYYTYDNKLVKKYTDRGIPVLVEVDFDGIIKTPNDRHWVLFIGDKKMIDPWTGKVESTSKYPILKGFALLDKA